MQRSILGVKRTDRIRYPTLRSKTQITDVAKKAAKLKWNWAGYVCWMLNELWVKIVTLWYPDMTSTHRNRHRRWWVDELEKTNVKWSTLAMNRERPLPTSEIIGELRRTKTSIMYVSYLYTAE